MTHTDSTPIGERTLRSLSVPGNLLLFGEYAVLEEGGLGIACALAPHVEVRVRPSSGFSISGRLGAQSYRFSSADGTETGGFLGAVASYLESRLESGGRSLSELDVHIDIDSSAFLAASGRKRGFGSSAAATVGLCEAVCDAVGMPEGDTSGAGGDGAGPRGKTRSGPAPGCGSGPAPGAARFTLAVEAHRSAQGGRGSGYDVAASYYGGLGLFRGGAAPELEPISLPWLPALSLYETGVTESSARAVARYTSWKAEHPEAAREFRARSNRLVSALVEETTWDAAREIVFALTRHGVELGQAIGVPAEVEKPDIADSDASVCKAVGAGAELALCFGLEPDPQRATSGSVDALRAVDIDWEGCRWY